MYAFDVHCNSYFPLFVMLYVVQFFLCPLLLSPGFLPTLLSNLLYAVTLSYYHYTQFLGYNGRCPSYCLCRQCLPCDLYALAL
jgi:hypothetical protein